jgi:hypothetical protein
VRRYDSVIDMQHHLEQIDVENEEYEAWDEKGDPLILSVQVPSPKVPLLRREYMSRGYSPVIWLRLDRSEAGNQGELADAIADFARRNQVALAGSSSKSLCPVCPLTFPSYKIVCFLHVVGTAQSSCLL